MSRRLLVAGSTKTFTCYKLPSHMHYPILFVKRHAIINVHTAARRSELAYRGRQ